jgi:hypothetical protein
MLTQMDSCVINPSSPTQDPMVSMILMASQVRPSPVFGLRIDMLMPWVFVGQLWMNPGSSTP